MSRIDAAVAAYRDDPSLENLAELISAQAEYTPPVRPTTAYMQAWLAGERSTLTDRRLDAARAVGEERAARLATPPEEWAKGASA